MSHIEILLPFGLPPAELATDLIRECKTPSLAMLIGRSQTAHPAPPSGQLDHFSRALPHETWLTRQFGLVCDGQSSPPIAPAAMQALKQAPAEGIWFIINPVHFHIARAHLVLTDRRQLLLSAQQSLALFDSAKPSFDEVDKTLVYGNAHTWFVRADDWSELETSTPDATCGHNIDIWMPKGAHALAWRKLQNEVQMVWHSHPVNEEREAHGLKPVNSVWLWGGAPADRTNDSVNFTDTFNLSGDFSAYGQLSPAHRTDCSVADLIAAAPKHGLLLLDALIEPALASDWASWLDRMHDYETSWFAPLLAALKTRRLDRLTLQCSHGSALAGFSSTRLTLGKFWVKPSLSKLATGTRS